jgi:hypothetical protein
VTLKRLVCRSVSVSRSGFLLRFATRSGRGFRLVFATWGCGRVRRTRWFDNRHREALFLGVGSRLLVRRPRPGHRLSGNPKPVHNFWPGPDGGALPGLRCVLDQLINSGVTSTVSARLDRHRLSPLLFSLPVPASGGVACVGFPVVGGPILTVTRTTRVHTDARGRVKRIYVLRTCARCTTDAPGRAMCW